jgi:hypothetical protein
MKTCVPMKAEPQANRAPQIKYLSVDHQRRRAGEGS